MTIKKKAVFLDRDGVINNDSENYIKSVDELKLIFGVEDVIKKIKDLGFLIIVITNQSAINQGLTTHEKINKIHFEIQNHLKKFDTFIDAFYYCPHRPDENCECRKPKSGLIYKASKDFDIEIQKSWMIGDRDSDIDAGITAGCKTIKIKDGLNLFDAFKMIKDVEINGKIL